MKRIVAIFGVITLLCALAVPNIVSVASGDSASPSDAPPVRAIDAASVGPGRVLLPSGNVASPGPVPPTRSTLDPAAYRAAKAAAAKANHDAGAKTAAPSSSTAGPLAPPTTTSVNFDGVNQSVAGGASTPDPIAAVGLNHFVELTNRHFDVYNKQTQALAKSVSLASFFNYTAASLFDPRVLYDPIYNRWVVTADALHESAGVQKLMIAVSTTSDPTGSFIVRALDMDTANNGNLFDFPMLGMDQDAIIVTTNVYKSESENVYLSTRMFAFAKARLYNNISQVLCTRDFGAIGTLAPPVVLDQNANTYLVSADAPGSVLRLYRAQNLSRSTNCFVSGATNVTVPSYSIPVSASQPGTTRTIDTSDARFVNNSTQVGNFLWNVHTVAYQGFPAPRFYQINTATSTVVQSGTFFASPSSYDWNASIAANASREVFVNWSSTDPPQNVNVQMRFSGRQAGDPAGTIPAGTALFTSPTPFSPPCVTPTCPPGPWGSYSSVALDPQTYLSQIGAVTCAANRRAWLVNEKVSSTATEWGTRAARVGFC
jgi:hypothetical protein